MDTILFQQNDVTLTTDGVNLYLYAPPKAHNFFEPFVYERIVIDSPENRTMMLEECNRRAAAHKSE